jgi:tetratricopeptide (TPR) repeat protein
MFKTFISTTTTRGVAEAFAGNGEEQPHKESVVFEMKINRKYTANPLSDVREFTEFKDEEETLLSMGNAFRIESVEKLADDGTVWIIRLKIANFLPVYLRKQMGESTTLFQLEKFILEPGFDFINDDSSKVKQLINTLDLKSIEMACFHVTIGHFQLNYEQKLFYYQKAIESLQQGHPLIPLMLNSIAAIYYCNAKYDDALNCYKYAMETNEGLLLSNDKLTQIIENLQKPPDQFVQFKDHELRSAALSYLSSGEEIAIDNTGHGNSCNKFGIPRFLKFNLGLKLEEQQIAYARNTHLPSEKEKNFENVCELYEQIAGLYAKEQNYTAAINNLQRLINFKGPPAESLHPITIQTTATIPPTMRIPLKDEETLGAPSNTVESYVPMNDYSEYYLSLS